jgi:recombination protein RecA
MSEEINLLINTINKKYKSKTINWADSDDVDTDLEYVPGSLPALDMIIANGRGWPRGRIIEIIGWEGSGKTTMALEIVSCFQKANLKVAYIDSELLISQPDSAEEALDIVETLAKSGKIGLIVVDSVAALTPQAELDGEMGDQQIGLQARLMSKAMRKLTGTARETKTTLVFINQLRNKIGVMFGSNETTTGGNGLKFFASLRLDLRKAKLLGPEEFPYGQITNVKVIKNKLAAPFRKCELHLLFGQGYDRYKSSLDVLVGLGFLTKGGAWYKKGDENFAHGEEKTIERLKADYTIEQINQIIKERLNPE